MADTPNASGEPGELYLDAAATESVSPAVIEAMTPFLTEAYANPASVHQPGKTAARALDAARASFAAALGARPDDVIFTSGGTESDNLAIKGIAMARMRKLGLAAGLRIRRSRWQTAGKLSPAHYHFRYRAPGRGPIGGMAARMVRFRSRAHSRGCASTSRSRRT